jgi:adenylate cyclase
MSIVKTGGESERTLENSDECLILTTNGDGMKKKQSTLLLLVPLAVSVVIVLLNLFTPFEAVERRLYDVLLHVRPAVPEHPALTIIEVDDLSIAREGTWPWPRNLMADGLITMREFGASYAVFDIEYVDKAPLGVNPDVLNQEIPAALNSEFGSVQQNVTDLFTALRERRVSLAQAGGFIKDLGDLTETSKASLLKKIAQVARDNDDLLGRSARLFQNAYFTMNMFPFVDPEVTDERRVQASQKLALPNVIAAPDYNRFATDVRPAIWPILGRAAGAGFPNVEVDKDGVRRRIDLFKGYKGKWIPQLGVSALLAWLGNPGIELSSQTIVLKSAKLPDGETKDIRIPLDGHQFMLINWPKEDFNHSFHHLSFYKLVQHKELERALAHTLSAMADAGYLLNYAKDGGAFLKEYADAEAILANARDTEKPELLPDYYKLRQSFFDAAFAFVNGDAETRIQADIDAVVAKPGTTESQKNDYEAVKGEVTNTFAEARRQAKDLADLRTELKDRLAGAFCIIGQTGTSTTDIGVTPFDGQYMNVGTHASVVNTILSGRFLDELPWWYSAIAGVIVAFIITFITRNVKPLTSILVGVAGFVLIMAGGSAFFIFTGSYFAIVTPGLIVFLTFLVLAVVNFLLTAQDRTFIRGAFGHYLSAAVINELLTNPEKLKLGGEKKYMTAMFTDVKGFSTISEKLDPTELVHLLNLYLSDMSDIVLDLMGTIDKYEGDAIISFFGAPLEMNDHARKACLAAIRMKRTEAELNKQFLADSLTPVPLLTRIGINTGDMVVGNMGTKRKMDYTMMGSNVNLAARLEGVNKQYGTWILTSETTRAQAGNDIFTRRLDRVRVVGINEPVRLYEVVEEASQVQAEMKELVEAFHSGLAWFEKKDWTRAAKDFGTVLRMHPDDGPATKYLQRCNEYKVKPPPDNWDGVFNLTEK